MLISIDNSAAAAWFTKEFEFHKPFCIRMYPQYAGFGQQHKGYSLAFSAETPANAGYTQEVDGITFFVEENDVWFFEETETFLTVDDMLEIQMTFNEMIKAIH